MEKLSKLNWLAIGVLLVVAQAVGFLWYGVLFKAGWQDATGVTDQMAEGAGFMPFVVAILSSLALFTTMAYVFKSANIRSLMGGLQMGIILWVGFSIFQMWMNNSYGMEKGSLTLINGGYLLVLFAVGGAVLGVWQKGESLSDVVDDVKKEAA